MILQNEIYSLNQISGRFVCKSCQLLTNDSRWGPNAFTGSITLYVRDNVWSVGQYRKINPDRIDVFLSCCFLASTEKKIVLHANRTLKIQVLRSNLLLAAYYTEFPWWKVNGLLAVWYERFFFCSNYKDMATIVRAFWLANAWSCLLSIAHSGAWAGNTDVFSWEIFLFTITISFNLQNERKRTLW